MITHRLLWAWAVFQFSATTGHALFGFWARKTDALSAKTCADFNNNSPCPPGKVLVAARTKECGGDECTSEECCEDEASTVKVPARYLRTLAEDPPETETVQGEDTEFPTQPRGRKENNLSP